jgi:hypothetical protein
MSDLLESRLTPEQRREAAQWDAILRKSTGSALPARLTTDAAGPAVVAYIKPTPPRRFEAGAATCECVPCPHAAHEYALRDKLERLQIEIELAYRNWSDDRRALRDALDKLDARSAEFGEVSL